MGVISIRTSLTKTQVNLLNNTWTYGALLRSVSSYAYSIVNWARV